LFEASALCLFLSFDVRLFCISLVGSLLPAGLLIGIWGSERRSQAAAKFLFYMFISAACLGAAIWGLHADTFDLVALANSRTISPSVTLFALALLAFLIRLPVAPFHDWMPTVLAEASGPVAALLGAIIPLTGGYGLLRFVLPLYRHTAITHWWVLSGFALLTILYASLRAWPEKNLKRAIAYGSVSVTGIAVLGMAVMTPAGLNGSMFILISQGLILTLMMIVMGRQAQGIELSGSIYVVFLGISWFAEIVIPGLIGALTVLLGVFDAARPDSVLRRAGLTSSGHVYILAIGASVGLVLLAVHAAATLRTAISNASNNDVKSDDLPASDFGFLAPLAAIIILLGCLPAPLFFGFTHQALVALLKMLRP
jgi:NADH-quinone oxidoreductase subunit M